MRRAVSHLSKSDADTRKHGEGLASLLHANPPAFVQLTGELGAGKTTFARGFIEQWLKLSGEPLPENLVSPTYNIVRTYGANPVLAHLDLYRLKNMSELEAIGFEHYFFEFPCCLVEWLEQIPEALAARPEHAVAVEIEFGKSENERVIKIRDPRKPS